MTKPRSTFGVRRLLLLATLLSATGTASASDKVQAERFMGLLRQRLLLSRDVAMAKFNSGAPVEDKKREQALIDTTLKATGQEHEFGYRILRAQIEASKVAQRRFLVKWAGHPRFSHAPNLTKDIRPKLDRITKQILEMSREFLGTSETALRHAAGRVQWPKADADCYRPAWKVAIEPAVHY